MNRHARLRAVLLSALVTVIAPGRVWSDEGSAACRRVPVEPATRETIGGDLIVNGRAVAVYAVSFAMPAGKVADTFRRYWANRNLPSHGATTPRGLTMSGLDEACQYVLELPAGQTGATTRGVMSVMRLDPRGQQHAISAAAIPLPDGRVLSDVESRDPLQVGRLWVIALTGDAASVASRYRQSLRERGWHTDVAASAPPTPPARDTRHALSMRKGPRRLDAVFFGLSGRASAVVNVVESP